MATLVVLQGGQAISHALTDDPVIVGRHPECTIQLDSNAVSRKHAQIVREGDAYFVEDLASGNGTFINGKRIEGNERIRLQHEDRIKFGPLLARFESDQRAARSQEPDELSQTISGIDISSDDTGSTILGSADRVGGFGVLEVRPEAKLKAVLEISRGLAGTVELETMLPKVLDSLFAIAAAFC